MLYMPQDLKRVLFAVKHEFRQKKSKSLGHLVKIWQQFSGYFSTKILLLASFTVWILRLYVFYRL